MEKITVTVVVNIPDSSVTEVFTRSFESLSELSDNLPGLDVETWNLTTVSKE